VGIGHQVGSWIKGNSTKMRILYVEDHAAFRAAVISRFLAAHQVTVAATLAEARALLPYEAFDVVLLDYDLPDGKGIELLEEIQRDGWTGRVIAVSSREENNARLMTAGAYAAVGKMKFAQINEVLEELERQLRP
jgi:DNA-binding response OmpR family regulator